MKDFIEKLLNSKKSSERKYVKLERNVTNNKLVEVAFKKNPLLEKLSDNYILLTNPELTGKFKEEYELKLRQDIADYVENKSEKSIEYNSDTMANLAYFRLQKVSKKYCLQKLYEDDKEVIEQLREEAKKYSMEYELTACLR